MAWRWLRRHQIGVVDSAGEAADARLEFEKVRVALGVPRNRKGVPSSVRFQGCSVPR